MTDLAAYTDRFRAAAAAAPPSPRSIKIALIGEGVIRIEGGTVSNEDAPADCTVHVARADLDAIAAGELDPSAAFMAGKLRLDGDMGVALELQDMLGSALG